MEATKCITDKGDVIDVTGRGMGVVNDFDTWGINLYSNLKKDDVNHIAELGYSKTSSWLASAALEAGKGDWSYGVGYSYQKGSDVENNKWFVNVNYSF